MRLLNLLKGVNGELTRKQRSQLFDYLEEKHKLLKRVEDKEVKKIILEQIELIHEVLGDEK